MNRYSLLARVAPRLTTQFENLATESLLYLLKRYGEAREAFVDLVSAVGYVGPRDLTFDTQVHMQHGSIPDLVGAATDGTDVLLVESKFWAPLTRNQPTGYLDRLPADRQGLVLFIAPERRYEELWQHLVARCRGAGLVLRDETGEPPDWRVVHTSDLGRLAYVSWSFVLGHLEGRLQEAGQERGAHEVWQLKGLCQWLEAPPDLGEDPWEELRSIVDEVAKRLVERDIFSIKRYRATPGTRSYRRYGTLSGHVNWFVGYNQGYSDRFEESSLLWVGGPSGDVRGRQPLLVAEANPLRSYELGKEVLFPLDVPSRAPREVVVQSLVAQIEGVAELLRSSDRRSSERGEAVGDEHVMTSETHPIYADFVSEEHTKVPGRLGMTFAPGMKTPARRGRWKRDLEADLRVLREEYGADVLVSVLEEHEYGGYGIPELFERDLVQGIEVLRFAIEDMNVPKEAEAQEYEELIRGIVARMREGKNVIVHCRGGLGRTGTVAACVLVALGDHSADEAIGAVRAARKGTVQTRDQEEFVRRFEETFGGRDGGSL